jgi:hypothetical protein
MPSAVQAARVDTESALPRRHLGQTGHEVTLFGLGGEGVLRTHGRTSEAVRVIHRALDQGVNYWVVTQILLRRS